MSDLISLTEAAAHIGKNLRTIQRYLKAGTLTAHPKDGKNFISRTELESKFSVKNQPSPPKSETIKPPSPPKVATQDSWQGEAHEYQKKWIDEVQKHAQTREELGQWKGRAEAYQAFASRLLGTGPNGVNEKIDLEQNPPEIKKEPLVNVNRSPQMSYSLIYYIAFAVLFVILILLFVIIRIYTS